jgi:hypothetical protein
LDAGAMYHKFPYLKIMFSNSLRSGIPFRYRLSGTRHNSIIQEYMIRSTRLSRLLGADPWKASTKDPLWSF